MCQAVNSFYVVKSKIAHRYDMVAGIECAILEKRHAKFTEIEKTNSN